MAMFPCCVPDGDEINCELVYGDDYGECVAACEALGGCPSGGPENMGLDCAGIDCTLIEVSCCSPVQDECMEGIAWWICAAISGFKAMCPNGCSPTQQQECDDHLHSIHPCCVQHECLEIIYPECVAAGGIYHWDLDACEAGTCDVGCRHYRDPRWDPGDKHHSLDLCVTAIAGITKPPPGQFLHANPLPGRHMLITLHEVRAVDSGQSDEDPCKLHYGVLVKGEDGRRYPMFCSSPDHTDLSKARWNIGYMTKETTDNGIVPKGRYYFRVGIEPPQHREVQFGHPQLICQSIE
jgi:hypothetical protein